MIWVAWLSTLTMVIFAYEWIRRKYFELFYYVHHLYTVVFITALIHAWAIWFFFIPGLVLFCIDKSIRFYRGAHTAEIVKLDYGYGGHTRLQLRMPASFSWAPM